MKELISVIVPVYNVEQYLDECINSIINQTYSNLEIILVNDGSRDNSPQICDRWAEIDNRIKVIHKDNGGLSDARNVGIDNCSGEFIAFIDSDDYMDLDYISKLYQAIEKNDVKIAQCGINVVKSKDYVIEQISFTENKTIAYNEFISGFYKDHSLDNVVVWSKLYHRSLFDNIRFPKGKLHEDEFTTYKIAYMAGNIGIISDCLYNYRVNPESITRNKYSLKRLDAIEALEERCVFFEKHNEDELLKKTSNRYIGIIEYCYSKCYFSYFEENRKDVLCYLKEKHKNAGLKYKPTSLKAKLKYMLFAVSPVLFAYGMKFGRKLN